MKCNLTLEIQNLHACPGDRTPKKLRVPKDVFSQIDVITETSAWEDGPTQDKGRQETTEMKRVKIEPLNAFKEENGNPIFRLGGSYGKLMGLFRETGSMLYLQKVKGYSTSYKPFLKSLIIKPQWVTLENPEEITIDTIPQITAGRNKSLLIQYYETIPRCEANIEISFPEKEKPRFETLLENIQGVPFGPKRRGEIQILEKTYVE